MNLKQTIKILNTLLKEKEPDIFNGEWIKNNNICVYNSIISNIRNPLEYIDWDRVVQSLDKKYQKRWNHNYGLEKRKGVDNNIESKLILSIYNKQLYTFIQTTESKERLMCDSISIDLVRMIQRGNNGLEKELIKLLRFTVDIWIENDCQLSRWYGYTDELISQIRGCIKRYRYSGSFLGYLYKTLEYSSRGLYQFCAYSLDNVDNENRRILGNV